MSRYWSGRGGLGEVNGRKIANALGVSITDLGLTEAGDVVDDLENLRRAQAALEETVVLLAIRVTSLELERAEPQRDQPARKRKAG